MIRAGGFGLAERAGFGTRAALAGFALSGGFAAPPGFAAPIGFGSFSRFTAPGGFAGFVGGFAGFVGGFAGFVGAFLAAVGGFGLGALGGFPAPSDPFDRSALGNGEPGIFVNSRRSRVM